MSKEMKDMKEIKEFVAGTLLGKYSCPECLSNDNLAVYIKHNEQGEEYMDGSCFSPSCKSLVNKRNKWWMIAWSKLTSVGVLKKGIHRCHEKSHDICGKPTKDNVCVGSLINNQS